MRIKTFRITTNLSISALHILYFVLQRNKNELKLREKKMVLHKDMYNES